jgi:C1A family cysteine protease
MRNIKAFGVFTLLLSLFGAGALHSQDDQRYPLGAILDNAVYSQLPRKAPLASRAYEGLPRAFSLKEYAPLPGDQNDYGTCVAWASAYAARTISESVALDRRNPTDTTRNAFSPVYIYRTIRPDDPECVRGAQISWALDLMKDSGAVKMLDIERTMAFPRIDISRYQDSRKYPIADYVTLFSQEERSKPGLIARMVKKSLVEGKPVIIGMNTPYSFMDADNVWQPEESPNNLYGGHALCVVAYDDDRNGGAFEVINSWGRKWGNGGFMWIPYTVFTDFVLEGYEIIENLAAYTDRVRFDGFVRVEVISDGGVRTVPLVFTPGGFYRTAEPLGEGTEFRFAAGAGESAYVYAFAASQAPEAAGSGFYRPVQMFPQTGVLPLLNYQDSVVILPGEDRTLVLDDVPGMEFLFVIYAKQALDLQAVMRRFEDASGTPRERIAAAVGMKVLSREVQYQEEGAAFTAETGNGQAAAVLIVAIDHR